MNLRSYHLDALCVLVAVALIAIGFVVNNRIEGSMYIQAAIVAGMLALWLRED